MHIFQHREKNGNVRAKRNVAEFRGTSAYASPHAHLKEDLCPRDDLYSLLFVLVDLLCGQLPWSAALRSKDKQGIAACKNDMLQDPNLFIKWIVAEARVSHESMVRVCL